MIETLFVVNKPKPKATSPNSVSPATSRENRVLDPKKAQNIAILLRALNVTIEEVCEGLLEGKCPLIWQTCSTSLHIAVLLIGLFHLLGFYLGMNSWHISFVARKYPFYLILRMNQYFIAEVSFALLNLEKIFNCFWPPEVQSIEFCFWKSDYKWNSVKFSWQWWIIEYWVLWTRAWA